MISLEASFVGAAMRETPASRGKASPSFRIDFSGEGSLRLCPLERESAGEDLSDAGGVGRVCEAAVVFEALMGDVSERVDEFSPGAPGAPDTEGTGTADEPEVIVFGFA